jgi:hypothetical protein
MRVSRLLILLASAGLVCLVVVVTEASSQTPSSSPEGIVGVTPTRVLDTRISLGASGPLTSGASLDLSLASTVPAEATSVLLNITADADATANSFITVWPTGAPQPNTSVINPTPGTVTTGSILVPLGNRRSVSFFNYAGTTQVVADLAGYTLPVSGTTNPGIAPAYAYDSVKNTFLGDGTQTSTATVTVPAGTYTASAELTASSSESVVACNLLDANGAKIDDINGVAPLAKLSIAGTASTHLGAVLTLEAITTVSFSCHAELDATADVASLTLIPLGAPLQAGNG